MVNQITFFFSGGGSGGHAVCAHSIIAYLQQNIPTAKIRYIGSRTGIERQLASQKQIPYYPIFTGKLRRSWAKENIKDFFLFLAGVFQAYFYLRRNAKKTDILVSTGGYVALPSVIAGKLNGMKTCLHEQTSRVGLSNKIASYFVDQIYISFQDSQRYFPRKKTLFTGYPLRKDFFSRSQREVIVSGKDIKKSKKKVLLITGGGNGSKLLNELTDGLPASFKKQFLIVHQVGKRFIDEYQDKSNTHYFPVSFIDHLPDVLCMADMVVCRAGAGIVSELIHLRKKTIFIPLKMAQKNEQWHNANEAAKSIPCEVLDEEKVNANLLKEKITTLLKKKAPKQIRNDKNPVENIYSALIELRNQPSDE